MTYELLEKATRLKLMVDDLTRRIKCVNGARGHILVIKAIGTPIEITIPEEMRDVVLDMLYGQFERERWDKREEFDAIGV